MNTITHINTSITMENYYHLCGSDIKDIAIILDILKEEQFMEKEDMSVDWLELGEDDSCMSVNITFILMTTHIMNLK